MKNYFKILPLFFAIFIGCKKSPHNTYLFPIEENRRFGLIDFDGNIVVPCKYNEIGKVEGDLVPVSYNPMFDCCFEWYHLNLKTQTLSKILRPFFAEVPSKPIYDNTGKLVFMADTSSVKKVAGGLYLCSHDNPKHTNTQTYFVNSAGVIKRKLPDSLQFQGYSESVYKLGFCSSIGANCTTIYTDTLFKEFFRFEAPMCEGHGFREGIACIPLYGYINKKGRFIFKSHSTYNDFSEHFAAINDIIKKEDGHIESKGGYIDTTGKLVIDYKFKLVYDFHEGLAGAQDFKTQLYGFIDTTGNWVISPQYTDIPYCLSCSYNRQRYTYQGFYNGLAMVEIGTKWGYINKQGKVVWWQSKN